MLNKLLSRLGALAVLGAGLALPLATHAAPITLQFEASGFVNDGVAFPGHDGLIKGSLSWDSANPGDELQAITALDLEIAGHRYTLNEVGIANQGTTQTAWGGTVRGANAVVGDGAVDDFLMVFDRVNPRIDAFAFSILGKTGAIWWTPSYSRAWFADVEVPHGVPLPGSLVLAGAGLLGLAAMRRRSSRPAFPSAAPGVA